LSACSALLKPKCQKMSSTRCNIFSLKRKRFVNFRPSGSRHLGKIASRHAGHGQHQELALLTLWLLLSKVRPPLPHWWDAILAFQRLRQDKGRPPCQECKRRNNQTLARLHPVLCCPFGRKKVNSTAMLRVLRQATVQNPQVRNSIVQVWIVLVAKRARAEGQFFWQHLGVSLLGPLCYFVRSKIGTSKISKFSFPAVQ